MGGGLDETNYYKSAIDHNTKDDLAYLANGAWSELLDKDEANKVKLQIADLKEMTRKYKEGELNDNQNKRYETLMNVIKQDLDNSLPETLTTKKMNEEVDTIYYMTHEKEAWDRADDIVGDPENMDTVKMVANIFAKSDYLHPESKEKLNRVLEELSRDLSNLLKNRKTSPNNRAR